MLCMLGDIFIQGGRSENEITGFQESSWKLFSGSRVFSFFSSNTSEVFRQKKKKKSLILNEVTTLSLGLIHKIIDLYF